jgi:hypothetical protein
MFSDLEEGALSAVSRSPIGWSGLAEGCRHKEEKVFIVVALAGLRN